MSSNDDANLSHTAKVPQLFGERERRPPAERVPHRPLRIDVGDSRTLFLTFGLNACSAHQFDKPCRRRVDTVAIVGGDQVEQQATGHGQA